MLAAPGHEVEVPEKSLLGGRQGPRIPGQAQRGRLPRELLVEVADVRAPRELGNEGGRQAAGQERVPAQGLQRGEEAGEEEAEAGGSGLGTGGC